MEPGEKYLLNVQSLVSIFLSVNNYFREEKSAANSFVSIRAFIFMDVRHTGL